MSRATRSAVFGRVGARPLNYEEQRKLWQRPDGRVWTVEDGKRDFNIRDPKQREWKLLESLRAFYPGYQSPDGKPLPPLPPTILAPPPAPDSPAPAPALKPYEFPLPGPGPIPNPKPNPVPQSALPTTSPRIE